jgi:hypothetical protein
MADSPFGSGRLRLRDDAFNYFKGDRFVTSGEQDTIPITSISSGADRTDQAVSDYKGEIFLFVFIDRDHNEHVDHEEFEFVRLRF